MSRPPEDDLFARFRDGRDPAALAAVFDLLAPGLLRVAVHVCGRMVDAEDLVQQTFLVAIERASAWDRELGLYPWLIGILTNLARLRRRSAQRVVDPTRVAATPSEPPGVAAERSELTTAIERAVDELGEVYQPVLHLHLFHGLDANEIGAALARPAGTVRTQIVRGLAHLRRALPVGLGIAGVTALGTGRGLAAMREIVLASSREACAVAGAGLAPALGGLLIMKKVALAVSLVLVVALGMVVFWPPDARTEPATPRGDNAPAALAGNARDGAGNASEEARGADSPTVTRTPTTPTTPTADLGHLRVTVHGPLAERRSARETVAVSGTGGPLADALVLVWPADDHVEPDTTTLDTTARHRGRTAHDGAITFRDLPAGAWRVQARIGARAEGAAHTITVAAGTTSTCALDLMVSGTVRGRVVDDAGRPVAGAEIWAGDEISRQFKPAVDLLRVAAVSADDGAFSLAFAPGEERIAARKTGFASPWAYPTAQLGDGAVTLVLTRDAASLTVLVIDSDDRPVADASVAVERQDQALQRAPDGTLLAPCLPILLRADGAGRFVATDLAPGTYTCRVTGPRHAAATLGFSVAAAGHRDLRARLEKTVSLRGRVLDAAGEGLAGVYVWVTMPSGSAITTRSTRAGHFVFTQVPTPPFVLQAARRASGTATRREFTAADGPDLACDLVLAERAGIRGLLRSETGDPVVAWRVTAHDAADATIATAHTDADGAFTLPDLGAGVFRLVVRADDDAQRAPVCERAGVVAGTDPIALVVPTAALPRAVIAGRVVGLDGHGLADAWLELVASDGGDSVPHQVGADGTFRVEGLAAGSYRLTVHAPDRLRQKQSVALAHAQTLLLGEIPLAPAANLRVRFRRPDGTPWGARPPVPWLQDDAGTWLVAGRAGDVDYAVDGDEVLVTGLPSGRYVVHGPRGDELIIEPREIVLSAGATLSLDLAVTIGRRRSLRFAPPPKSAPATVLLLEVHDSNGKRVLHADSARGFSTGFGYTHVFAFGTYVVTARTDAGTTYRATFTVGAERTGEETVEVPLAR